MAKRIWRPVGQIVLLLILCGFFAAGIAGVLSGRGHFEKPFDDNDLQVTRPSIPDNENAYFYFVQCALAVNYADGSEEELLLWKGHVPSPQFLTHFLSDNTEAIGLYEQAVQCDSAVYNPSFPELESEDRNGYYALVNALVLRSELMGDTDLGVEHAMKTVEIGEKIKNAKGPLFIFLIGLTVQSRGYDLLVMTLYDDSPFTGDTPELIRKLGECQNDGAALADALRSEYMMFIEKMDSELNDRSWLFTITEKRHLAESSREFIQYADSPMRDYKLEEFLFEDASNGLLRWFEPPTVLYIDDILFSGVPRVLATVTLTRSYNSAVQVLLALKVYHMRHGDFPESLDALVPEFFDELPRDWFDGGPIKYNRDKALVYCVGSDLEDNGGSDPNTNWTRAEDPSWAINFASRVPEEEIESPASPEEHPP